ncbi:MAG TPA: 3-dehydroquinate synthase [Bacteroidales bacterium]|nr:3-dehydroquinate synthase [Bacteroidales bacterium]
MEKIIIDTSDSRSEIRVGEKWQKVLELLPVSGVVIITDENINKLYGNDFPAFPIFTVSPGEESKSISTIEELGLRLLDEGADRSWFILAIGGGVVCDIAGFLAAIYMRGINCGYVSTSLLSQVDASTGGKNGVNLGGVKNILGTIRQPEFVICDPSMLRTLPEDEYYSGLSELIKTAVIGDRGLFELLEQHHEDIISRNPEILEIFISRAVRIKASVVSEDEKEKGLRRILNFGHTFGHAIEMERSLKHGFAVASGMELAAAFSYETGLCNREDTDRIINILKLYNLIDHEYIPVESMKQLMTHDKKRSGDDINFVFTSGPGNAEVQKIPASTILDFYKRFTEKAKKI